jgi:hypothetical protein
MLLAAGARNVFAMDAAWRPAVARLVLPFHENRPPAARERNCLGNHPKVIDLWDWRAA